MKKSNIVIDNNGTKRPLTEDEYAEYIQNNQAETINVSLEKRVESVEAAMREMLLMIGGKANV